MQPRVIALLVWIGIHRSTVSLDRIPISSGLAVVFHQEYFSVVRGGYIAPENAETTVGDTRSHRGALDMNYEHVSGNPDVTWGHLDPALGIHSYLLFAKLTRCRGKAV